MATVESGDVRDATQRQREEKRFAEAPHLVQAASEESFLASVTPSWPLVTGIGLSCGEQVLRQCGRFTLARDEQGFCWVLRSKESVWYWHPEVQWWVAPAVLTSLSWKPRLESTRLWPMNWPESWMSSLRKPNICCPAEHQ